MEKESYYLDELVNSGMAVTIDGREFRFAELRVKDFARMQEHLRRIQPKPSDLIASALKSSGLAAEEIAKAMIVAYEADLYWPASIDSQLGMRMIESDPAARAALVRYSLEKHHPNLTEFEAGAIIESMSLRLWNVIAVYVASGRRPTDTHDTPEKEESGPGEPASGQTGTP